MGAHGHGKGEFMLGYSFERSSTSGYKQGSSSVSNASLMAVFGEIAAEMQMDMHMFELMYGISDNLTLMVMPQYMQMSMLHQSSHGGGHSHEHEVQGFGDTEVIGLYSIFNGESEGVSQKAHLNFGLSLPTGSYDETFVNHHNDTYNMPYSMQFGTGTYDPIIGATYVANSPDWSWGAQTINYIRVGKNNNGYRQGNKYTATSWVSKNLSDYTSVSFRLDGERWNDVSGMDASLPVTAIAGAEPNKQAGERVLANIGLSLLATEDFGFAAGNRLALEFGVPIYERYSGAQPDNEYRLTLGWQKSF
jgi:hypothetical protein